MSHHKEQWKERKWNLKKDHYYYYSIYSHEITVDILLAAILCNY